MWGEMAFTNFQTRLAGGFSPLAFASMLCDLPPDYPRRYHLSFQVAQRCPLILIYLAVHHQFAKLHFPLSFPFLVFNFILVVVFLLENICSRTMSDFPPIQHLWKMSIRG